MRKIGDKRGVLSPIWSFQIQNAFFKSFIIPNLDVMSWDAEGIPGDVQPAGAGEELVGEFTGFEEVDKMLEF